MYPSGAADAETFHRPAAGARGQRQSATVVPVRLAFRLESAHGNFILMPDELLARVRVGIILDGAAQADMNIRAESRYPYDAFISYAHEDEDTAQRLERILSRQWVPLKRSRRIYRDRSHLRAGHLPSEIAQAVSASKFLIVCASVHAVQSDWVRREIELFLQRGSDFGKRILFCRVGTPGVQELEVTSFVTNIIGHDFYVPDFRSFPAKMSSEQERQFQLEALSLLAVIMGLPDRQAVLATRARLRLLLAAVVLVPTLIAVLGWAWIRWTDAGSRYLIVRQLRASPAFRGNLRDVPERYLLALGLAKYPICSMFSDRQLQASEVPPLAVAAEALFASGNAAAAAACVAKMEATLRKDGTYPDAWQSVVEAFALTEQPNHAERVIEIIKEREPLVSLVRPLLLTAETCYRAGRANKARAFLEEAREEASSGAISHVRYDAVQIQPLVALAQCNIGDCEGAAQALLSLWRERKPKNVDDFSRGYTSFVLAALADIGKADDARLLLHEVPGEVSMSTTIRGAVARTYLNIAFGAAISGDAAAVSHSIDESLAVGLDGLEESDFHRFAGIVAALADAGDRKHATEILARLDSGALRPPAEIPVSVRPSGLMGLWKSPWQAPYSEGWAMLGEKTLAFRSLALTGDYHPSSVPQAPPHVIRALAMIYAATGQLSRAKESADTAESLTDLTARRALYAAILLHHSLRSDPPKRRRWADMARMRLRTKITGTSIEFEF
jgi:hypothetical protein